MVSFVSSYTFHAIFLLPPDLRITAHRLGFLPRRPWAGWNQMSLDEPAQVALRSPLSILAFICICTQSAVVSRVFPWLPWKVFYCRVEGREDSRIPGRIVQTLRWRLDAPKESITF